MVERQTPAHPLELEIPMRCSPEEITVAPNVLETSSVIATYVPDLIYAKGFDVSSVFDCGDEMKRYAGDVDYHSLMHNVQKPSLVSRNVEALSFFANKLVLREWVDGLVPIQKSFGFSSDLSDELEIKRLFQIVVSKVRSLEEFIIKPVNGSESIGTLKAFLYLGEIRTQFLGSSKIDRLDFNGDAVISDYDSFKYWIQETMLGTTSGNIDTHLRHIQPGLIIQELFPHDQEQRGPTEMKFNTAWGELLYVGCRNSKGVCLGKDGEHLEGDLGLAHVLQALFFENLKGMALSLARASTFPNLRFDFFVDIESGEWVLNEIATLADCRSYPNYILATTGEFYLKGWIENAYRKFETPLTVPLLRERLCSEMMKPAA
ncbi:MAG: hypothetical protein H8E45_05480 [Proteobacteria bacterium]|nr:hypothetical protein [Pseudomonadota bacterium]